MICGNSARGKAGQPVDARKVFWRLGSTRHSVTGLGLQDVDATVSCGRLHESQELGRWRAAQAVGPKWEEERRKRERSEQFRIRSEQEGEE